jgi:hypothetical protein
MGKLRVDAQSDAVVQRLIAGELRARGRVGTGRAEFEMIGAHEWQSYQPDGPSVILAGTRNFDVQVTDARADQEISHASEPGAGLEQVQEHPSDKNKKYRKRGAKEYASKSDGIEKILKILENEGIGYLSERGNTSKIAEEIRKICTKYDEDPVSATLYKWIEDAKEIFRQRRNAPSGNSGN